MAEQQLFRAYGTTVPPHIKPNGLSEAAKNYYQELLHYVKQVFYTQALGSRFIYLR